jgi:hypothetical protein
MPARRWARAADVVVRTVAGVSLSRRWRVVGVEASSRQALPSPLPENEDFCQLPGAFIGLITLPSPACG